MKLLSLHKNRYVQTRVMFPILMLAAVNKRLAVYFS